MFTWSLGCTGWVGSESFARLAITSLAFMLLEVPDPVWNTSSGNCSSKIPAATRSAAAPIRSASSASSRPSSWFTCAAALLIRPSQWITEIGTRSPEIGKFSSAFAVSPPHSCCCSCTLIPVLSRVRWLL